MVTKHETKACPRCGNEFECKPGSVLLCQCNLIRLSEEQLDFVSDRYEGCLCVACLSELRSEYKSSIQPELNKRPSGNWPRA